MSGQLHGSCNFMALCVYGGMHAPICMCFVALCVGVCMHQYVCMYLEDAFKTYLLSLTKICLFLAICTPVGLGCALECSSQQRKEGVVECPGAGVRWAWPVWC